MLRPIANGHENIMSTGFWNLWRRIWGLTEEGGTYVAAGVIFDGGKRYLRCFR